MLPNRNRDRAGSLLNSRTFEQQQINLILGQSIQSLHQEVVREPIPEHLQALVEQLDRKAFLENTPQFKAGADREEYFSFYR